MGGGGTIDLGQGKHLIGDSTLLALISTLGASASILGIETTRTGGLIVPILDGVIGSGAAQENGFEVIAHAQPFTRDGHDGTGDDVEDPPEHAGGNMVSMKGGEDEVDEVKGGGKVKA